MDVRQIVVILKLNKGTSFPQWNFSQPFNIINEQIIDDDTKLVTVEIVTTNNTSITLEYSGKTTQETIVDAAGTILKDQSLVVENILVNDIKIELLAIKDYLKFVPEYTASRIKYAEEHGIDLSKEIYTDHMYDNGIWTFTFERPFFLWYNKVLMALIDNSETNVWIKRSHLGLPGNDTLTRLDSLLEKL